MTPGRPPVTPQPQQTQSESRLQFSRSESATPESTKSEKNSNSRGIISNDRKELGYVPIKARSTGNLEGLEQRTMGERAVSEENTLRALSRRRSSKPGASSEKSGGEDETEGVDLLLSRMFGRTRQEHSEEERSRHVGVTWENLTVKGTGVGAALQPKAGDLFVGPFRFFQRLFRTGRARDKPPVRTLLHDFTGCVKPGEMLLVLGRPGAGCSTFLKVVGNQRSGYEGIEGEVKYGGVDAKTMHKKYRSEVLYNPEDDFHYATLTVKSTLKFALRTRTPGQASRKEGESRSDYVNEFLRVVSKLFWIEHTMNTKVGNELIQGISGGEKKRVSIAEAMITKASTQCWDNSTRGLDASTALEYVTSLRALTNMVNISTCVALYQAGESLYELFDKVLLIDEGHCCYFGPTDQAAQYFKDLGFERPDRWTTADFLTSVTDKHERHAREGWEDRIPRSPEEFAQALAQSKIREQNLSEIETFREEMESMRQQHSPNERPKNYTLSFPMQVWVCTKRQFLVMIGDKQSLGGKWGGILFQALIVGSLFYDLPKTTSGVFTRGGVMFFMLLFNALLALAELTAAFESKPILLKHKSFTFYRPAAYAIAQTVVDVPLVLVQVTIFLVIVYFMANLQRTASQFFIAYLFLFIVTMTMYAFFRSIGALMGSLDAATRVTGVAIQALVVYTGYLIPPRKMHPWFSWLRWINPVQYGFEALMANEFYSLDIQCEPPYLVPMVPNASPRYQSCALAGSNPGSNVVRGSDYIKTAFGYSRGHLWRNFGFICAFFGFFVALTALGMELQKPNKGGGGVVVYERGQALDVERSLEHQSPSDEESGEKQETVEGNVDSRNANEETKDPTEGLAKNESVLTFQDICYTIPYQGGERMLLQHVQGYVQPGKLTALMGASGAGKTTLLNALAQRIRVGTVTGDFLVDGRPLPRSFQRSSGFAEQQDVHEPTATVREALRFSAKLRQPPEVPLQEKYDYCEKIIDLLEMRSIAGAVIGTPGEGLNQEQRKRLTIGVELASKPELLMFLDEPTSGLDSGAAFNIVRFLRKLADAGQAILCTIHQPSSILFEEFDRLLLLESGGRTVYFGDLGPDSRTLLEYFERNGGKKCPSHANPAEHMLDVIGAGNPDYKGKDWGEVWSNSEENAALTEEIYHIVKSRHDASAADHTKDDREYAMPLSTQVLAVVHRSFTAMWRSPKYVIGMFMLHVFTGLFNGFTFWNLGHSQIDMQSHVFSIFMTLTISPPLIQQLQPRFLHARGIYESREAKAKIYSWIAFTTGAIVSEIPYRAVAGTVYWACWYWAPSFPRGTYRAAVIWMFIQVFELFYLGFGQAIASFSPNDLLASILVPLFFLFVISFCGVVVPLAAMIKFWHWMYHLSPFRYLFEGMLALIVHEIPVRCDQVELAVFSAPPGQTCNSYTQQYVQKAGGYVVTLPNGECGFCQYANGDQFAASFNVFWKNVWRDYGIFWAYIIFNFAMVFFCTWLYLVQGRKIKQRVQRLWPAGK
ncbi:ABC drug exporter AtrF [Trichodelitschia bisporula]|uniref:ABC drug exporter AtrF n=1 Tax=Trichodelitschia bisporula TaxID=703511 RepID=A0A6G1HM14_9PEZI|nr:ABC drug exporter AtrF [Trichodelitschia bisporula]